MKIRENPWQGFLDHLPIFVEIKNQDIVRRFNIQHIDYRFLQWNDIQWARKQIHNFCDEMFGRKRFYLDCAAHGGPIWQDLFLTDMDSALIFILWMG